MCGRFLRRRSWPRHRDRPAGDPRRSRRAWIHNLSRDGARLNYCVETARAFGNCARHCCRLGQTLLSSAMMGTAVSLSTVVSRRQVPRVHARETSDRGRPASHLVRRKPHGGSDHHGRQPLPGCLRLVPRWQTASGFPGRPRRKRGGHLAAAHCCQTARGNRRVEEIVSKPGVDPLRKPFFTGRTMDRIRCRYR